MNYVKTFEEFNYQDDELIVEKLNLAPIIDKFKKAVDKASIASILIGSLLTVFTVTQAANFISNQDVFSSLEKSELFQALKKKDKNPTKISSIKDFKVDSNVGVDDGKSEMDKLSTRKLLDVSNLSISESGLNQIKKHERLKLKAYSIGDGMVTVGYGHAERTKKSNYKVGDKITREKANELLRQDLKVAEDGVKRLFSQWDKKNIHIKVTQGQYDSMVSMAFNMGVGGLRRSKFIQYVKKNDMKKAAEEIKKTGLKKGFSGLVKRRNSEYELFRP